MIKRFSFLSLLIVTAVVCSFSAKTVLAQGEQISFIVDYSKVNLTYSGPVSVKYAIVDPANMNTPLWTNDGTFNGNGEPNSFVISYLNGGTLHENLGDPNRMNLLPINLLDGVVNALVRMWVDTGGGNFVELGSEPLPATGTAYSCSQVLQNDPADTGKLAYYDGAQLEAADIAVAKNAGRTSMAIGVGASPVAAFPLSLAASSGRGLVQFSRTNFESWQFWITNTGQRGLEIRTASNNNDVVYLAESGNVGIGTQNPAGKLDVAGALAVNGTQVINSSGRWVGSPTGLKGDAGPKGDKGDRGPQGQTGPKGDTGIKGDPGANASPSRTFCATSNASFCRNVCSGSYVAIVNAPCMVTSDTGPCTNPNSGGSCCVCLP